MNTRPLISTALGSHFKSIFAHRLPAGSIAYPASLLAAILALLLAMLEVEPAGAGFCVVLHALTVAAFLASWAADRRLRFRFSLRGCALFLLAGGAFGWYLAAAARSDVPETASRAAIVAIDAALLSWTFARIARLRPLTTLLSIFAGHLVAFALLAALAPEYFPITLVSIPAGLVCLGLAGALLGVGQRVGRARWVASVLSLLVLSAAFLVVRFHAYASAVADTQTTSFPLSRQAAIDQAVRSEFFLHPLGGIGPGTLVEHLRGRGLSLPRRQLPLPASKEKNTAPNARNRPETPQPATTATRAIDSVSILAVETGAIGFALFAASILFVFFRGLYAVLANRDRSLSILLLALLAFWVFALLDGALSVSLAQSYGILVFCSVGGTIWGAANRLGDSENVAARNSVAARNNIALQDATPTSNESVSAIAPAPILIIPSARPRFAAIAVWTAFLLLALAFVWIVARPYRAERTLARLSSASDEDEKNAVAGFERARSLAPFASEIPYRFAFRLRQGLQSHIRARGWDEAAVERVAQLYRDAIRLNPYREEYRASQVDFYALLRRYDVARQVLAEAAAYCPNSLVLTRWQGRIGELSGDPDLLERSLQRAVRLASSSPDPSSPFDPSIQFNFLAELCVLYERLGQADKLRETQAQIVLLSPDKILRDLPLPSRAAPKPTSSDLDFPTVP